MNRAATASSRERSNNSIDELERLRQEHSRSERDTQRLLEGAVHDLRAAQRGISTSLEILRTSIDGAPDAQTEAVFRRLHEATAKMDGILAGISSYTLSLPSARPSLGLVPMESMLRSAEAALDHELRECGGTVSHGKLPEIPGDGERIKTLFQNLIDNALKFRSDSALRIDVQARLDGDKWIVSVKDNGIGIDPKYWNALFTPFKRLHGSEIPGAGLGLAICKRIVETHGGRIWIESEPGSGTTFLFALPAEDEA